MRLIGRRGSVAVSAGFISSGAATRRRPAELIDSGPAALVDQGLWPKCPRFDGGVQPCTCWCAAQRQEWVEAGNEWPGGPQQELGDLIDIHKRYPCREPFDPSTI